MKPCSVENCTNPARAKGMCPKHYQRVRKHGDPSVTLPKGASITEKGQRVVDSVTQIQDYIDEGYTIEAVAKHYGVCHQTIRKWMNFNYGYKPRGHKTEIKTNLSRELLTRKW